MSAPRPGALVHPHLHTRACLPARPLRHHLSWARPDPGEPVVPSGPGPHFSVTGQIVNSAGVPGHLIWPLLQPGRSASDTDMRKRAASSKQAAGQIGPVGRRAGPRPRLIAGDAAGGTGSGGSWCHGARTSAISPHSPRPLSCFAGFERDSPGLQSLLCDLGPGTKLSECPSLFPGRGY